MSQNYTVSIWKTHEYKPLSNAQKKKLGNRILLVLFLEAYDYNVRLEIEESTDTTSKKSDKEESVYFYDMPPLEGDDEK